MKTVKKIKLHNLSQAEMADKEMNLLKGGSGLSGYCISICLDAVCKCAEERSGTFPASESTRQTYDSTSESEKGISNLAKSSSSSGGGNGGGSGTIDKLV